MLKPDLRVRSCMRHLNSAEMAPLKDYLVGLRDEAFIRMTTLADDAALRQHQGKAKFLCDLLTEIEEAARI